jgi:RNA polymerase sigma factor (sigma-70 family)
MGNNHTINKVANHYRRTCSLSGPDYQDLKSHLQAKMLAIHTPEEKSAAQIYTILRNAALDYVRRHIYHTKGIESLEARLELGFEPEDKTVDPDINILVEECLATLTPKQRLVTELYFGLLDAEPTTSFPTIAARVNVSPVVARRLYESAILRLRIIAGTTEAASVICCRN